ncbi:glycerophosphodiester phosphodiesterase [Nocardioides mesophilus]|uniref:glycerophosphodiester phosphodiesterase n=1 Tax=Nocardioides mesophilus TaxID=433659 RepID=UPI0031B573C0
MTRPRTGYPFLDEPFEVAGSQWPVLAFAHRGGSFHPEIEGLENTLAAFQHAVDLGYRYLETDVHTTRDGVLLAFHDAVLDRVTASTGSLAELPYDVVADALIGGREQIPRLVDLLDRFPEARFNIDLKSDQAVTPLAALIHRRGLADRVCVASFSPRRLHRFRRLAGPRVATACGPAAVVATRFAPTRGASVRLVRSPGVALQIPHHRGPVTVVTRELVRRAHAAGRHVHVWTVDVAEQMHELLDLGVDGLMTDRTDVLRDVLRDRGQWMGDPS